MTVRNFFFRYRGITPIPFVLLLIIQSDLNRWGFLLGLLIVGLGESIRIAGVRQAGGCTRTRKVGASALVTSGVYAHVRNPLYLGNVIIYFGFAIMAGGPWLFYLMGIALLYFSIQYGFIIALEEEKLHEIFGKEYEEYKQHVPRLLPRFGVWRKDTERTPKRWQRVLRSERSTLLNQLVFTIALILKEILVNTTNVF